MTFLYHTTLSWILIIMFWISDWERTSLEKSIRFFRTSFLQPMLKACKVCILCCYISRIISPSKGIHIQQFVPCEISSWSTWYPQELGHTVLKKKEIGHTVEAGLIMWWSSSYWVDWKHHSSICLLKVGKTRLVSLKLSSTFETERINFTVFTCLMLRMAV